MLSRARVYRDVWNLSGFGLVGFFEINDQGVLFSVARLDAHGDPGDCETHNHENRLGNVGFFELP